MTEGVLSAARKGNTDLILQWIQNGADPNTIIDDKGNTALHWVCNTTNSDLVLTLLREGANPNATNSLQATPLHWACKHANSTHVKYLLQYGADPTLRNAHGRTSHDLARISGSSIVLSTLQPYLEKHELIGQKNSLLQKNEQPSGTNTSRSDPYEMVALESSSNTTPNRSGSTNSLAMMDIASRHVQASTAYDMHQRDQLVEDLKAHITNLQKEKMAIESQSRGYNELKQKLENMSKEKVRLEVRIQQMEMEEEEKLRKMRNDFKVTKEKELKQHLDTANDATTEKRQLESEIRRLQSRLDEELEEKANMHGQMYAKDTQVQEANNTLRQIRSENCRLETELKHLQSLKSTMADLQRDNALLQLEISSTESLKKNCASLQMDKSKLESELRQTQQELAQSQSTLQLTQQRMQSVENQLESLVLIRDNYEAAQQEKMKLEIQVQRLTEEVNRKNNETKSQNDAVDFGKNELQETLEKVQNEKFELAKTNKINEHQIAKLKAELLELREEKRTLMAASSEVITLKGKLDNAVSESVRLQEELNILTSKYETLQITHQRVAQDKALLESESKSMANSKETIQRLEREKVELEVQLSQKKVKLQEFEDHTNQLQADKREMENQMKNLKTNHSNVIGLQRDCDSLRKELQSAHEELSRMQQQYRLLQERTFSEGDREREEMEIKLQSLHKDNLKLISDVRQLTEQLHTTQDEAARLREEGAQIVQKQSRVAHESAQQLSQQHSMQMQNLQHKIQQLQQAVDMIGSERDSLQMSVKAKEKEITELTTQVHELKGEVRMSRRELGNVQSQLQSELEKHRQRAWLMEKERQGLEVQMKALKEQATLAIMPRMEHEPSGGKYLLTDSDAMSPYKYDIYADEEKTKGMGFDEPLPVPPLGQLKEDQRRQRMGNFVSLRNAGINNASKRAAADGSPGPLYGVPRLPVRS